MPRFAANLSMLYTELPFLERYAAAARDGFDAVECLFPYDVDPSAIATRLADHGLTQVLINAPAGDREAGDRGLACLPGREDEFRRGFEQSALPYAAALGCKRIHVMAGTAPAGARRQDLDTTYLQNLQWAASLAGSAGITVLIEPINHRDFPGYHLNTQAQAHAVVEQLATPHLKVQMDLYHCQVTEGDLAAKLRRYVPTGHVGHIQFAGAPERHEPDIGEIHYPYLFELIDALGYEGVVSAEYRPRGATPDGLGWLRPWRLAPRAA